MLGETNFLSRLRAGRLVYIVGGILYAGLGLTLAIADLLLGREEWHATRKAVLTLSDGFLYPFPNDLLPLFYGVADSWHGAIWIVGGLNLAFFWLAGRFVQARKTNKARLYAVVGYLLFSAFAYFSANYLFFSIYFMRPHS